VAQLDISFLQNTEAFKACIMYYNTWDHEIAYLLLLKLICRFHIQAWFLNYLPTVTKPALALLKYI